MSGWQATYDRLRRLDGVTPLEPAALIELSIAAYLIGRDRESLAAMIRAQQRLAQQRDLRRAGGIAARIAGVLLGSGESAQAAGWMARAARLLDESGDAGVERGYLLVTLARQSIASGDVAAAAAQFAEAAAIGDRHADADLTGLARQGHGRALIEMGEIARGIALLDEVMVAVTAGEVSTIFAGIIYCSVLSACVDVFDVGRAREWTEALTRWCDSEPEMVPYRGECLVHRAEVMSLRGVWTDALHEALLACERLAEPPGQPALSAALYQVAELHRLRRDFTGAEAAYRRAADAGRSPYPGLALLRLAQRRGQDAAAAIARVLRETRHRRARARVLSAATEIMLANEDVAGARRVADELAALADDVGTPFLRAAAAQAHAAVFLAEGDPATALARGRSAWTLWRELGVPYEVARAHVLIARACLALGDGDSAAIDFEAARRTFTRLGARVDLERLQDLAAPRRVTVLTPREIQVLRLVATGRTNKAIAGELAISEKTIARHIANIFNKLDLPSRAAATAYAFEHDLVDRST